MDKFKFVELKIQGKVDQFFLVNYLILDANSQLLERGESSLPPCRELVANIRDWRKAYRASVQYTRLEILQESINNSSDIDHQKLVTNLKDNLNNWLSSPEFLPLKENLISKFDPQEVVLVGIDVNDPDLKYAPWHLWNFFDYFPKADFALLSNNYSQPNVDYQPETQVRSKINITAIIGDSRGINTTEDTIIIKNLPHVNHPQILSEPSRDEVIEALWSKESVDILFFAGHGKREDSQGEIQGRININDDDSLSIKEIKEGLEKRIQKGLKLAIFNSCDGLELGEEIAGLYIPQTIVMKEAVPDFIAQRFLKDFLAEFSQGVSLVQALRQTRKKLKDQEHNYPYASWLPVLYYNPTQPLMEWVSPPSLVSQKHFWQNLIKISPRIILVILFIALGIIVLKYSNKELLGQNNPSNNNQTLSENHKKTSCDTQLKYIQLNCPENWRFRVMAGGNTVEFFPIENPKFIAQVNIEDFSNRVLLTDQYKQEIIQDLKKHSEDFQLIEVKPTSLTNKKGYKITYTNTRKGVRYQGVNILTKNGIHGYSINYMIPESSRDMFSKYESEVKEILNSLRNVS